MVGPVRYYLGTGVVADISPAVDPAWERNATGFARHKLSTTKDNSALADQASLQGSVATDQTCWHQWVSDPLPFDRVIGGVFDGVVRGQELLGTEDACLAYSLRVLSNDGLTVRGTLRLHHDATITEMNTATPTTRTIDAEALTPVAAVAGDRIVLEIGIHGVTPSNTANIIIRFGAPSATADFAQTQGLTTDLDPWVQFSDPILDAVILGSTIDAPASDLASITTVD